MKIKELFEEKLTWNQLQQKIQKLRDTYYHLDHSLNAFRSDASCNQIEGKKKKIEQEIESLYKQQQLLPRLPHPQDIIDYKQKLNRLMDKLQNTDKSDSQYNVLQMRIQNIEKELQRIEQITKELSK